MKSFKHSSGIIIVFGFDPFNKVPNPDVVAWSDDDGSWVLRGSSKAGFQEQRWVLGSFDDVTEIHENDAGDVFAYSTVYEYRLAYLGSPVSGVWNISAETLRKKPRKTKVAA